MGKKTLPEGSSTTWKRRLGITEPSSSSFQGRSNDILILLTGPTGVGKSTFIKDYTASQDVAVGHKLRSCTQQVTWYEARLPSYHRQLQGRRLILVDTPGFDDTHSNDAEILRRITGWLAQAYNDSAPVAGLVYLNDITQKRMLGSTKVNLQMFVKLCGGKSFRNVVLGTTQWDVLADPKIGEERESELKDDFWSEVIKGGATTMAIRRKPQDLNAIVDHLLGNFVQREQENQILQIQKEVVDLEQIIPATEAGQELRYTIKEVLRLQRDAMIADLDEDDKQELMTKRELMKKQARALKLPFGLRLKMFFGLA